MVKKSKLVCGVGVNDADYAVRKSETAVENGKKVCRRIWSCPFYVKWTGVLVRCYSEKFIRKYPTYEGCYVCDEWLSFSNFKNWMEQQDWEGKDLDKDILYPDNKIYSPETCVFVSQAVNKFLLDGVKIRGDWPTGVCWNKQKNKFMAYISAGYRKSNHLGYFLCPEEAHAAWLSAKRIQAKELAEIQTDPRVAKALVDRYLNYEEDIQTPGCIYLNHLKQSLGRTLTKKEIQMLMQKYIRGVPVEKVLEEME